MGTWQYAEGREKTRNARDKTETDKGHPGVESAVQRLWHSTPTHKPPVRRQPFSLFFSLPSAYCHVPILSGLPTLAMCPYRLGAWVVLKCTELYLPCMCIKEFQQLRFAMEFDFTKFAAHLCAHTLGSVTYICTFLIQNIPIYGHTDMHKQVHLRGCKPAQLARCIPGCANQHTTQDNVPRVPVILFT